MHAPCALLAASLVLLPAAAAAQDNAPPENDDGLNVSGQGGLSWSTGNTKALVASMAVRSDLKVGPNQFAVSTFYSYSAATVVPEGAPDDAPAQHFVADNTMYGRLRYDRSFLGDRNALFLGVVAFRDTSSGFNARVMPFTGYERILLQKDNVGELWVEGGYRTAYELLNRDPQALRDGVPSDRLVHGPTAFVGGKIDISPQFSLDLGFEGQERLTDWHDFRINAVASAMSFIGHSLSFGLNFNARYLLTPIGARAHTDTSLQAVLVSAHDFPL